MRLIAQLIYEFCRNGRNIFAVSKNLFIVKTYYIALVKRETVHLGGSHGVSNLPRRYVVYRVEHVYKVFVRRNFGVEGKRGGDTLRYALGRHYVYLLTLDERFGLLGGEYYVLVVGENENVFGVYLYYSVGYILRGRVHRLTALYNPVAVKIFEYIRKTRTRTNRKHTHFFLFRLVLSDKFAVFYFYLVDLAELQRLGQRLIGIVGVYVYFYKFEVAYNEYAIAYRHKIFFKPVYIGERGFLF